MRYYKFMHLRDGKLKSDSGDMEWEIDKEYSVKGEIVKCQNGFHASKEPLDALNYVKGNVVALVEASGDSDNDTDRVCFRNMKIIKAYHWKSEDSVKLAIYCAEQVLKIYEDKYPDDSRPRDAIKAAKAYLKNPNKKTAYAAARAAYAAAYAADAANAAAYAAADAAARAAYAAARAAYAAAYAADAAARAAYAAYAAAYAADKELRTKINRVFKSRIKKLEQV